jgi:hypothetical protein
MNEKDDAQRQFRTPEERHEAFRRMQESMRLPEGFDQEELARRILKTWREQRIARRSPFWRVRLPWLRTQSRDPA